MTQNTTKLCLIRLSQHSTKIVLIRRKDRSITMFKESLEITVAIGLGLAVGRLITSGIPEKRKPKGDDDFKERTGVGESDQTMAEYLYLQLNNTWNAVVAVVAPLPPPPPDPPNPHF
ncbi:uncharacterized protein [Mytilus edulis]|uniref:uncharacterized protein isoform X1 n=2 Tax=Mytilus edulis TaxID=6550 RepID=UPI0039EEF954